MKNKYLACLLGWLVPGLGHYYIGSQWKAAVFFCFITASAFAGWIMGDFRNVYFMPGHYQFYAEIGNGFFTAIVSLAMRITNAAPIEATARGSVLGGTLPIADLYCMLAGLLNFVVAANAYDSASAAAREKA